MGNLGSWSYVDGRERGAKRSVVYGDRARRRWSISSVTSWNSEEAPYLRSAPITCRTLTARFSPEYKRFVLGISEAVMFMINHSPMNVKNLSHILKLDHLFN